MFLEHRHAAVIWVQRLKRVFKIDIESCEQCGGVVRVIAFLEVVAKWILDHLGKHSDSEKIHTHPV